MQYKLDLNLQQRAILRIAIWFWERKEVKDRITKFFRFRVNIYRYIDTYEIDCEWDKLTKSVVDEWNKDVLPKHLEAELIHIVKMIGETIFNWYRYIKHRCKVKGTAINCIDKVHWTPYGTVDVVKIFKSSWLQNPYLNIPNIYDFSCRYTITDSINELWDKIPRNVQDDFYYYDSYDHFDHHIIAYWKHYRDNNLHYLMSEFLIAANDFSTEDIEVFNLIYDLSRSTEENMLRLSVYQGYFIATKYFWERLTEKERDESVLKCARIAVMRYRDSLYENEDIEGYKKSQYVEICLFLMNQMSDGHKKALFNEKSGLGESRCFVNVDVKSTILKMLLCTWPWEELFFPVLEDMLRYVDDDSEMDCQFLDAITSRMGVDHQLGYSLETSKYRFLLREVWLNIPAHFKQKIPQINPYSGFINNLIDVWDLDSLNLIINDPEIADIRDEFINLGSRSYEQLVEKDKYEKLNQFIHKILKYDEDIKRFKQNINPWHLLIIKDPFHLADKLLDWQSSTSEERKSLKKNIDPVQICHDLIDRNACKLVDKFLDWKFDTKEEKRSCKNLFKNNILLIKRVCRVWITNQENINKAKKECSEFLHWFFESEDEITLFKNVKVFEFAMEDSILNYLDIIKNNNNLYEFMSWCMLDDKQVQQIKQAVSRLNL